MVNLLSESEFHVLKCVFWGKKMKQFKQPLLTIVVIFAAAYILSLVSCAPSTGTLAAPKSGPSLTVNPVGNSAATDLELVQVDPKNMSLCTDGEFSNLQIWSTTLNAAESSIKAITKKSIGPEKDDVTKMALKAIKLCDNLQLYHTQNPCKKIVKTIVNPEGLVKAYDGFRIHARCEIPNTYLTSIHQRPDPANRVDPIQPPVVVVAPTVPAAPEPAVVITPVLDPAPTADGEARDIHECNDLEFTRLKAFRAALDMANKNIAKLGARENWKYETNSVDSANLASELCASAISYHQAQPCKRFIKNDKTAVMDLKVYSAITLRQQCSTVRTYNLEFKQQDASLISANAKLYLDTSIIANSSIAPGYSSGKQLGQCIISNSSSNTVSYTGQKTLVTEARVYPNNGVEGFQMFVMITAEGIKFECYGLDYQSVKTSKSEVVRLLKQKQTNISLSYELN